MTRALCETEALSMGAASPRARDAALRNSLGNFTTIRNGTIRLVDHLSEEQAGYKPDRHTWSVAQILDHLLLFEALYRTQIGRMLDAAREGTRSNIDVGLGELDLSIPFVPKVLMPMIELPLTVMNLFVPSALREALLRFPIVKAKNPRVSEPAPARPVAELREQLGSSLAETEALLAEPLPRRAARVTLSHPLLGRNTIANIFGLMAAHEERHGIQISRLLRQPGFPAGRTL